MCSTQQQKRKCGVHQTEEALLCLLTFLAFRMLTTSSRKNSKSSSPMRSRKLEQITISLATLAFSRSAAAAHVMHAEIAGHDMPALTTMSCTG